MEEVIKKVYNTGMVEHIKNGVVRKKVEWERTFFYDKNGKLLKEKRKGAFGFVKTHDGNKVIVRHNDGTIEHYLNLTNHESYCDNGKWIHGKLHNSNGPAIISPGGCIGYSGGKGKYKAWYRFGRKHRLDGPAVEGLHGYKRYYVDGKEATKREFKVVAKFN